MAVECYDGAIYVNKILSERRKVNFLCSWLCYLLMCHFSTDRLLTGKLVTYNMTFPSAGKEAFDGKNA